MTEPDEIPDTESAQLREERPAEERPTAPKRRARGLVLGGTVTVARREKTQEGE